MLSPAIVTALIEATGHEFEMLEQKFIKFRGEFLDLSHFRLEELEEFHKLESGRKETLIDAILHKIGFSKSVPQFAVDPNVAVTPAPVVAPEEEKVVEPATEKTDVKLVVDTYEHTVKDEQPVTE